MRWAKSLISRLGLHGLMAIAALLLFSVCFWLLEQASTPVNNNEVTAATQQAVPETLPSVNCEVSNCLALTFDDGPEAQNTPRVLELLQKYQAKATFFVLGNHVADNQAVVRQIYAEGHEIGNHSWDHPYFSTLSPEQIRQQIDSTQSALLAAGVPAPQIFRPPYGDMNDSVRAHVPMAIIRWNIDPEDWHPTRRAHMLEHLQYFAKPGGIVVLHDTEVTIVEALEPLLQTLSPHYKLVTVSELLNIAPGQRGVFFGR